MLVSVKRNGGIVKVGSPYNRKWTIEAKRLGGRWDSSTRSWLFDDRNELLVRDALLDIYGTDGESNCETVTLRVEWKNDDYVSCGPFEIEGRTIAQAFGRDSGAKLGEGVVLLRGGFASGGRRRSWVTQVSAGTVVLVHDVPRRIAEIEIFNNQGSTSKSYSIHQDDAGFQIDRLMAERDRIIKRLAVIDAMVASFSHCIEPSIQSADEDLCDTPD